MKDHLNITISCLLSEIFFTRLPIISASQSPVIFLSFDAGLKFLVRLCTDQGLDKEVQEFAVKLKKAEKSKELREQVCFSLHASPTVSVELKFPVKLISFSDASRVCEPANESLFLVACWVCKNTELFS